MECLGKRRRTQETLSTNKIMDSFSREGSRPRGLSKDNSFLRRFSLQHGNAFAKPVRFGEDVLN